MGGYRWEQRSQQILNIPWTTYMNYSPWNSPGLDSGVGSLSLLQGIFPTQVSNPGLPHCRWIIYQMSHHGSPNIHQQEPKNDGRQERRRCPDKKVGRTEMLICVVLCVASSSFLYLGPLFTTITLHEQVGRWGRSNRKE